MMKRVLHVEREQQLVEILKSFKEDQIDTAVEECDRLTVAGFLALAQSPTIANVSLSLDPLTPADVERIIQAATNVTWWFIRDRQGQLELGALARLADERQIRISVVDANNHSRSVKNTQPNAAQ